MNTIEENLKQIEREAKEALSQLEPRPRDSIASTIVANHLHGVLESLAALRGQIAEMECQNRNANNSVSNIAADLLRVTAGWDKLAQEVVDLREQLSAGGRMIDERTAERDEILRHSRTFGASSRALALELREQIATLEAAAKEREERVKVMEAALQVLKLRIIFIGWPAEAMWDSGDGVMIPDWRQEVAILEAALSPTSTPSTKLEAQ